MDPIVRRALERGVTAFLLTFVLGSGVVLAFGSIGGDDDARASASPDPNASPGESPAPVAETPRAYLVWVPGGFPETFAEELTTIGAVKRAAVATAGVAWLTRSTDADGDVVDDPDPPFMVPLEVTGTDPQAFASFLPSGAGRDLLTGLEPGQAILSTSSAKLRGLGEGATLTVDPGLDLEVVGTLAGRAHGRLRGAGAPPDRGADRRRPPSLRAPPAARRCRSSRREAHRGPPRALRPAGA